MVFVLDAETGILRQDKKVADRIVENRKACIVVVNKWDLFEQPCAPARKEERVQRRPTSAANSDAVAAHLIPCPR